MTDSNNNPKSPRPARRRARKDNGSFKPDNAATPHNEAWESIDISDGLSTNDVEKTVTKKVEGTSQPSAGKYAKSKKIRPCFGKVHTTYN